MPFGLSLPGSAARQQRAQDEAAAKKAEADRILQQKEQERLERIEGLLPWGLEQKVAVFLNPIKIPLIVAVGILGSFIEAKVAIISSGAWQRSWTSTGPQCMVHNANLTALTVDHPSMDHFAEMLDSLFESPITTIKTKLKDAGCEEIDNQTRCTVLDKSDYINISFDSDTCGVHYDAATDTCLTPADLDPESYVEVDEADSPGMEYRLPCVPFSLIWMIFKLVFLPIHVVDRLCNLVQGNPTPRPEPMFKLLTEPYCDPTTSVGKACGVCKPCAIISKIIRFSLLPNSLILPLLSLQTVPKCEGLLIYFQDVQFGWYIYGWLIWDLVSVFVVYALAQTVLGGKAIRTWWYRAYKFAASCATLTAFVLFILDLITTTNLRIWQGISVILRIVFSLKLGFDFTLDVTQTLANTVVVLDAIQLTVLIMSFVCPKLIAKAPIPDWIREYVASPNDVGNNANEAEMARLPEDEGSSAGDSEAALLPKR